jgi:hypothetical protein
VLSKCLWVYYSLCKPRSAKIAFFWAYKDQIFVRVGSPMTRALQISSVMRVRYALRMFGRKTTVSTSGTIMMASNYSRNTLTKRTDVVGAG